MQIHFDKSVAPEGDFTVHAAAAALAVIDVGPLNLYVQGPEDADRLIRAATEAKRLMEERAEADDVYRLTAKGEAVAATEAPSAVAS